MKQNNRATYPSYVHGLLLGLLVLVLLILQSAPGEGIALFGVRPMPLVMLTCLTGVIYGEYAGGIMGLITGILMDVYTVPSVAFHVVLLTGLGMVCGLAVKHLLTHNLLAVFVLCLGCCLLYFTLYFALFHWILGDSSWYYWVRFSLPGTVYTWITGMILYPILKKMYAHW